MSCFGSLGVFTFPSCKTGRILVSIISWVQIQCLQSLSKEANIAANWNILFLYWFKCLAYKILNEGKKPTVFTSSWRPLRFITDLWNLVLYIIVIVFWCTLSRFFLVSVFLNILFDVQRTSNWQYFFLFQVYDYRWESRR